MNTLEIQKPAHIDIGLRAAFYRILGSTRDALESWRQRNRQSELDAYLGLSQNMSDLERRLREVQYPQDPQGRGFF
jgi:hypothetical protein